MKETNKNQWLHIYILFANASNFPHKKQSTINIWSLTQERWIETNSKLSNEIGHLSLRLSFTDLGQELAGARSCDGTQIIDQIIVSHTNSCVCHV